MRKLIRTDGTTLDFQDAISIKAIGQTINADTLDTVTLYHMGSPLHVMLVDDNGQGKRLPVNDEATKLYLVNCRAGTTYSIRGDVIVAPDEDFA